MAHRSEPDLAVGPPVAGGRRLGVGEERQGMGVPFSPKRVACDVGKCGYHGGHGWFGEAHRSVSRWRMMKASDGGASGWRRRSVFAKNGVRGRRLRRRLGVDERRLGRLLRAPPSGGSSPVQLRRGAERGAPASSRLLLPPSPPIPLLPSLPPLHSSSSPLLLLLLSLGQGGVGWRVVARALVLVRSGVARGAGGGSPFIAAGEGDRAGTAQRSGARARSSDL